MHLLSADTIKGLAECKVESLLCSLRAVSLAGQGRCEQQFRDCGLELGVQVAKNGTVMANEELEQVIVDDLNREKNGVSSENKIDGR
jgi:hypothetical protein